MPYIKELHSFPPLQSSPFNSCHITHHHTHLLFCLRGWKVMEWSRAFKQERNKTRVISTVHASLTPQGLLSSTQEANLLNMPLIACQKGVKKRRRKKGGGRKKKVSAATCAITPPHANVVTLSCSSPPISGKRGLNIASPAFFQSGRTAWRETRMQSSLISREQVYRPARKRLGSYLAGIDSFQS